MIPSTHLALSIPEVRDKVLKSSCLGRHGFRQSPLFFVLFCWLLVVCSCCFDVVSDTVRYSYRRVQKSTVRASAVVPCRTRNRHKQGVAVRPSRERSCFARTNDYS